MSAPTAPALDLAPLVGGWVNFDPAATGIHRLHATVTATSAGSRLLLRISERDTAEGVTATATVTATPLADDPDAPDGAPAVGFLGEERVGARSLLLCGYVNRGLLTIDVHINAAPRLMYRAHYYRP